MSHHNAMMSKSNITYVFNRLSDCGNLGKLLLQHRKCFNLLNTEIFPSFAMLDDLDFRWGLSGNAPQCDMLRDFTNKLDIQLLNPKKFCLFRECDFKKSDPCVQDGNYNMIFVGDDVYYLLSSTKNQLVIQETIKAGNKSMLMCEFTDCAKPLKNRETLTADAFNALFDHLCAIAIGIFDDQGVCYIPFNLNPCNHE